MEAELGTQNGYTPHDVHVYGIIEGTETVVVKDVSPATFDHRQEDSQS